MKTKRTISLLLSFVVLLSAVVFTVPMSVSAASNDIAATYSLQAYQAFLDNIVNVKDFTGVAYVTKNGKVLCQSANGMQNTKKNQPMTMDTLFPLGSVSKQFCATAVLLLQEDGKLSVNDTLDKYFPEYEIGKDVTIQNLLTMRSGIRDHVNIDYDYKGHEIPTDQYTLLNTSTAKENHKAITDWLFTQELKFTPGTSYSYSNANFLLLSIIVEKVSGMTYPDFVKENIFAPLNMTHSGFYEELVHSPDLAEHSFPIGIRPSDPDYHGLSQGAGDLVSNAEDMDKWLTSLYECTLLSQESYKEMTTDYGENYGYGIGVDTKNGLIGHQGNIATYESYACTYPNEKINIFVITNDVDKMYSKNLSMATFANAISRKITTNLLLGDVDSDSEVSILDATAIQLHFAQIKALSEEQINNGDTDGDKELSVLDATAIQLFLAQL
ncbi:MAG: serine hydrolase [Ruminococcus sp.]|nr:serine hydrolase [Ruminococcus sp.]